MRHKFGRTTAILMVTAAVIPVTSRAASWSEIDTGLPGVGVGVNALAIDPASPSTLYAQTVSNGQSSAVVPSLFKTTDGGASWRAVGSVSSVICLAIDPSKSSTLYAGTGQGVVKSTNAGASWTDSGNGLPAGSVTRLVIDPKTPSTLYAVTISEPVTFPGGPGAMAIFKTMDSGGSWSALNTGIPASGYITTLVIDPVNPSTLYTFAPPFDPTGTGAAPVGGFLKSVDGGQSWQPLNLGSQSVFLSSLAVDPASNLYAVTNQGLLKSMDGGQTWTALNGGLPPGVSASMVLIDPATPATVYAVTVSYGPTGPGFGLLQSVDGGASWSAFNIGLPPYASITSLVVDPLSPARIYVGAVAAQLGPLGVSAPPSAAGAGPGGVFKSADGGETWNMSNAGLLGYDVRALAINPADASILAGGFGGAFRSNDGGATWNSTGLSAYTGTLAAGPAGLYALTGSSNGCDSSDSLLFGSTDGGANWSNTVSPLNSGCILNAVFPSVHTTPIAIDPTNPNILYLGESDDQDGYTAVLKSIDGGADWRAPWDWFNGLRGGVMALAMDPVHSTTLYAGIDDGTAASGPFQAAQDSSGLFKSTDGGASWTNTGLTTSAVSLLAIDPANPQIIYAGVEGHYSQPAGFQGVFKSVDGGKSWLAVNNGLAGLLGSRSIAATALVVDPANSQLLYLGTSSSGVFQSSNGGVDWSPLNDGLANLQIRALAVVPGAVYAATSGGVFKYSN